MSSKRLAQLRRQKELILEQLNWIELEIDRETLAHAPSSSPKTSRLLEAISEKRLVTESLEVPDPEEASAEQVASELYDELGPDTRSAVLDTKRGCMIFGGLAFASLAGLFAYVIFWY